MPARSGTARPAAPSLAEIVRILRPDGIARSAEHVATRPASPSELIERLREVDTACAPIDILEIVTGNDAVAVLTTFALPEGALLHFAQWFWVADA